MEPRTSATARILAAIALVASTIAVVALIAAALGGDDGSSPGGEQATTAAETQQSKPKTKAKTYVVKSGDTLTAIAHETGISVREILALNPEVDPQILIAGETLKLR